MSQTDYTSDEVRILQEQEKLSDQGQLAIKYNAIRTKEGNYLISRTIGVLPYGLNGEAKPKDFVGKIIFPAIRDIPEGQLGEVIGRDLTTGFPKLWSRMHLVFGEDITRTEFPSHVTHGDNGLVIKTLSTSH